MKRNFSLLFFLKKGKTDQEGNSSIYMRITIEKKRVDLATGKQCADTDWFNGKIVGSSAYAKSIRYVGITHVSPYGPGRRLPLRFRIIEMISTSQEFSVPHGIMLHSTISKNRCIAPIYSG